MEKTIRNRKIGNIRFFSFDGDEECTAHIRAELLDRGREICDVLMYFNGKGAFAMNGYHILRADTSQEEFEKCVKQLQRKLNDGGVIFSKIF